MFGLRDEEYNVGQLPVIYINCAMRDLEFNLVKVLFNVIASSPISSINHLLSSCFHKDSSEMINGATIVRRTRLLECST